LKTEFSGHPLVDEMAEVAEQFRGERDLDLIALLPGSREREISALFPPMLDAAEILLKDYPELKFATSGATESLTELLRELVREKGLESAVEVEKGSSRRLMCQAGQGIVASGTATLEAALLGLPYALTYKVAWITAVAARRLMKVDYLGIVNVLSDREVVKELLQERASGQSIADELRALRSDSARREQLQRDLIAVKETLGGGGAFQTTAKLIAEAV
ncbi:MAG: lipid-A-disaccharide synthase, partial [Verrucomicrobiota bacterium]